MSTDKAPRRFLGWEIAELVESGNPSVPTDEYIDAYWHDRAIKAIEAELQRERRKVEKLRAQRNQALGQNYAWQYRKLDAELEAIDKGEG